MAGVLTVDVYVVVMGQDVGALRPLEQLLCERTSPDPMHARKVLHH